MVKGITRQVIVVQSPDRTVFEQAIFIVKEDAADITDEILMKEAQKAIRQPQIEGKSGYYSLLWALGGAFLTGLVWLLTSLF